MTVSTFQQTNSTSQTVAAYPPNIDANFSVLTRIGDIFAPHAQASANMTIALDPGYVLSGTSLTTLAAQNTATFVAPVTNPRIDRVVVDQMSGVVSVVTGTEAASPVPPAIPVGKLPVAQVSLQTSTTSIINSIITDERALFALGLGSASTKNTGNTVVDPGTGALEIAMPVSVQTGGTYTYVAADRGELKQRSNSGAVMVDTLPGTGSGVMAAGWVTTIENNDASALMSIAAGSGAALHGAPQGFLILGPNQSATVASDGTSYNVVKAPNRVRLAANTTLYVSTGGSDSNTGIATGTSFLTIQKALNIVSSFYDLSGYILAVQVADGTYTGGISVSAPFTGSGTVQVIGDTVTPSNCIISTTGTNCITVSGGASLSIGGFKTQTSAATYVHILSTDTGSAVYVNGNWNFGGGASNMAYTHVYATVGGLIVITANYTISYGATNHWYALYNGVIYANSLTVTLSGTPAFTDFAVAFGNATLGVTANTYSGSATGTRYSAAYNGYINSGVTLPGSIAGSATNGGQYS